MKTAVFTIASRNYFAFVHTLMKSLEKTNPSWDRFVALADEMTDEFVARPRNFDLISLEELDLPDYKKMLFRYTILEFNTAIKPFVFKMLLSKMGYDRIIYFDPDIFVYEKLNEIEDLFDRGEQIILTPHFTGLWKDDKLPDEVAIMQAGAYNLGFLAVANGEDTRSLLEWWADKLKYKCVVLLEKGIFVDQKWMDLVPGLFSNVAILRHEGYNVAYWNLSHRKASKKDNRYYFNNQILKFFHFSGLNPNDISNVSKYQNRFDINNVGMVREIIIKYASDVTSNDFAIYSKYAYKYNEFDDGSEINDMFRYAYRDNLWLQEKCGANPFYCHNIFIQERRKIVSYMLHYIWNHSVDVQEAYPNKMSVGYLNWFKSVGALECGIDKQYVKDIEHEISKINIKTLIKKISLNFRTHLRKNLPNSIYIKIRRVYQKLSKRKRK